MAIERIIGVDFGTSTSVIRVKRYENGKEIGEKLETKEVIFGGNGAMVPTLVMRKDDDAAVCYFGYEAQQKKKNFSNFHSFKMDLESSDPEKRALARGLTENFYFYLAKQYKSQSNGGHLGSFDDQERTIISYPVKWQDETKKFMLETARKAGFPNVTGMDEAQAAIQAVIVMSTEYLQKHGLLLKDIATNILLIDMGAGTTDLVLARYLPGDKPKMNVLNTWPKSGDVQFGGREVDNLLRAYFQALLCDEDAQTVEKIFRRVGADKFKSWKEETVSPALRKKDFVSDFAALDERVEDEEIDLEYCLDRAAFEDFLADYLKQFPELINGCLNNAGMNGNDVDLVIVTGGHSQWYFVNEMLSGNLSHLGHLKLSKIQENPARIIPISRPQETVALGLAYSGIHIEMSDTSNKKTENNNNKTEPPVGVPDTQKESTDKQKTDHNEANEVLIIKADPSAKPSMSGNHDVCFNGTVVNGKVRAGEKVFIYPKGFKPQYATVKSIFRASDQTQLSKANQGEQISMILSGVSLDFVQSCTYISSKYEQISEPPVDEPPVDEPFPRLPPKELVQRFFAQYPQSKLAKFSNTKSSSIEKQRVHLRVPPNEPILVAKDCSWFGSGKCGTIITPSGIYIREDFSNPDYISWSEFVEGLLILDDGSNNVLLHNSTTGQDRTIGYYLGTDCAKSAFQCYELLQKVLRPNGISLEPDLDLTEKNNNALPDTNTYTVYQGKSVLGAAMTVKDYFTSQNMETQYIKTDDSILVQARAIGGVWQQFLGLDRAISIRFTSIGNEQVTVEIGGGKWADKAISAAVSMAVLWPLFLTSSIGAFEQAKLLKDTKNMVETYFYGQEKE